MKQRRTLGWLCAVTVLMSIFLCVSAFAEPQTDDNAVDMTGIKRILLTMKQAYVMPLPSEDGKVRCEYNPDLYDVTLDVKEDTLLIDVKSKTGSRPEIGKGIYAFIQVPLEGYDVFEVDAEEAEFFHVPETIPIYADWKVTAKDRCHIILMYPAGVGNSIDMQIGGINSWGEILISKEAKDYAVNIKAEKSSIVTGMNFPDYDWSGAYEYVDGDGKAKIIVTVETSKVNIGTLNIWDEDEPDDSDEKASDA